MTLEIGHTSQAHTLSAHSLVYTTAYHGRGEHHRCDIVEAGDSPLGMLVDGVEKVTECSHQNQQCNKLERK